ncbi:MAG: GAF domain-containing protein [Pseudomonadota bacterium]
MVRRTPNNIARETHVQNVLSTVDSKSAAALSRIAASWRRSVTHHGLDPTIDGPKDLATDREIRLRRESLERVLHIATPKLDQLFGLVGQSGCAVVLTDRDGLIIDQRFGAADAAQFHQWGLVSGADWSEAAEGTNGIGTCLAENRSVIVHRDEHFLSKNTAMSCIDTPIYGADGEILAALDVSSARADQTETINKLIAAMVAQTARQIEIENFSAVFPNARIVVTDAGETDKTALLAVDADDIVIGATRGARQRFGWCLSGALKPIAASDVLGHRSEQSGFAGAERAAVIRALTRAGGNVSAAARALGVSRVTLYRRMKRLSISDQTRDT